MTGTPRWTHKPWTACTALGKRNRYGVLSCSTRADDRSYECLPWCCVQVTVYRLVCKNTVEERILRRAQYKFTIQKTVYSGGFKLQQTGKGLAKGRAAADAHNAAVSAAIVDAGVGDLGSIFKASELKVSWISPQRRKGGNRLFLCDEHGRT